MKNVPFHAGGAATWSTELFWDGRESGRRRLPMRKGLSSKVTYCSNSSRLSAVLLFWLAESFTTESRKEARAEANCGSSHSAKTELFVRISPEGVPRHSK